MERDRFPQRLNLGSGAMRVDGFVNVDMYDGDGIDIVHNLDVHPWPFFSGSVIEVMALDIYEHVDDPIGFMAELWRICQPGAPIRLRTTYWKSENSFTDPTHKRFLTERSFDYWDPSKEYHRRYGEGYARGGHFSIDWVGVDGQELEWRLSRTDVCVCFN